jgi:glycosyltransferase involved in cell wall biosynthesis
MAIATALVTDHCTAVKVVNVVTRLSIGGVTHHVTNLMRSLDPTKYEQQVVCGFEGAGERSMRDRIQAQGVTPILIPKLVGNPRLNASDGTAFVHILRLFRLERPVIVHTHTSKAGLLGRLAARLAGVPIVVHTFHGLVLKSHYGPLKSSAVRAVERWLAGFSDRLITIGNEDKKDLLAYRIAPAQKIEVIPVGLELDQFIDCGNRRGVLHRELSLDSANRLIGIVGRIAPVKNHRLFFDAMARVLAGCTNTHVVVAGDGDLRPAMERYVREIGIANRVSFLGWRYDLPQVYTDLDVVVISSNNEGTPVTAIEAMAAGRPVVATRVGGLPDVISDGETGYLVPPGNVEQLASAVERVLGDGETTERLRRKARESVRHKFVVDRLATDIDLLYRKLLAEKGFEAKRDAFLGSCPWSGGLERAGKRFLKRPRATR